MTDRLLPDLPSPTPVVIPTSLSLRENPDESLLLRASTRWRDSSQGLCELFANVPTTRGTINRLLEQRGLDGQQAGLAFPASDEHPARFVSLTNACAFVFQHPVLETTLDQRCQVTGLGRSHPLFALTPLQLLDRLKSLNLEQAISGSWAAYWGDRAPGTPMSRRDRAVQLYRNHFEATAQIALAQRTLTAEQMKPLLLLADSAATDLHLDNQPVRTEQLALVLSNNSKVKHPAVWVISVGDAQWLYLPCRPVAIKAFPERSDMETWLSQQMLVPQGMLYKDIRFEYSARTQPLTVGITDLLLHQQQAQLASLRMSSNDVCELAAHGAQSLTYADQIDRQRSSAAGFALPPSLGNTAVTTDSADEYQQALFGSLYADIPRSPRQASLDKQRDAIEKLLGNDPESDRQQKLKDSLSALEAAEQAANTAASALLYRSRVLDLTTFNRQFTALYQAHKAGLHAEADLQLALEQMSSDEHRLLKALLDTPNDSRPDSVVASLSLSMRVQNGEKTTVTTQELSGPFVITQPEALLNAASSQSLLLYWPGTGGGLQRFASRQALERQLFRIQQNDLVALQLKKITTDPLHYSLDQQTTGFEEKAGQIRQRYTDATQATQRADELETLRKQTLATLQVPVHAARHLAFAHRQEQNRSATLASGLPGWLSKLSGNDRIEFKTLIEAYITAMHRSHAQLEIALPARDEFTRKHLQSRLREDFSIKGSFDLKLDLPDSVILQKQLADGAAPGTPQKLVAVPSKTRSTMTLEELAQLNIDNTPSMNLEPLSLRLGFMRVKVTADDETERQTLTAGITRPYLRKVLPELDLPQVYENLIRRAFMGSIDNTAFVNDHQRESLIEPWRLMLKLQGKCAYLQKQIGQDALQVLNIAIDANTPQAWNVDGKRIVLLPAYLSAGGRDTPNQGPVTLSGVSFIEEQVSGMTLLYLPDSPDGQFLRRYDSLEKARQALFNLCQRSAMVSYLAGRALQGSVPAHISRINQAVLRHFNAMIGVGMRWPSTTSLADNLLNAHMGRLIEAHRGTSRSNDALYLERYALKGPRAFNYLKMALGLVPFVGTAFALYDAWTSANQAVAAFLRGEVGDGLAEIESVLLALIDAVMNLLPGELAASALSRGARSLTRARQLRRLVTNANALHVPSTRQARHVVERFAGYEYEKPLSLSGLHPATDGLYCNIYRHADGDFIVRQGRIFQVERSKDSRNWRLSGTRQKTYKQPIALDETGHWDTYFGVYGVAFEGGGIGGGGVLGHMADALDPLWPAAIRHRLPRWWTDHTFRRHHALTEAADDLAMQIDARLRRSSAALEAYNTDPLERRPALLQAAETACIGDIELSLRHYQTLVDLHPLTHGNKRRALVEIQSSSALLLADRYKQRVFFANHRANPLVDRIDALTASLEPIPASSLPARLRILEEIRKLRMELVKELEHTQAHMTDLNHWYRRITANAEKAQITEEVTMLNARLSEANILYLITGNLLETVKCFDSIHDVSWMLLQNQAHPIRTRVDRALFSQYSLPDVSATKTQRNQILQDCIEQYTQFRRDMNAWTASYPQHFYLEVVPPLLGGIEKMAERARKAIDLPAPPAQAGQGSKKVFTTENDQLLIGVERWEPTTQLRQYTLTGQGGYTEIWEQGTNGKSRLLNPQHEQPARPLRRDLEVLLTEARHRLESQDTYKTRVQSYAAQNMLPVDLEHMMVSEANELTRRALGIEEIAPRNPLIQQLRGKATELIATGRAMRTRQTLLSKKPTDGMLNDLVSQNVVDVRKPAPIKNLGKRRDGRTDYMQEYEIWDLTQAPPKILWYAHFHYSKAAPAFDGFEKAHLKLPEHRFLTHADDATLPYSDIGKNSAALPHFENL
ncbi:dermonecrotic toxin domain-containing protein [Pseudomonas sp. LB3P38]|uniref:dermonecrotic toxin domain-containing protein n=1 Tax=Pseudomonas lyxosi TaxID=3398358 RepID=UPI0039EED20A